MPKAVTTDKRHYVDGHFTNVKELKDGVFEGVVATSNMDRMGEILSIDGLDTANFMKVNPIVIFGHNYNEPEYTIGKALSIAKTKDGKLPATFEIFDDIVESKAPLVKKLIKKGVLGLSIGFVPKEIDGDTYTKSEMVEFSVVPVPANAEGAITGRSLGLTKKEWNFVFKGAISTSLPLADEAVSWDSGEAIKRIKAWASNDAGEIDFAKYRKAFFWVDPENADKQGGYKLPYADVIDGELKAVWRAVAAAFGVMQGARGGVSIPDSDKASVLTQIKKYYKKFGKDVPEEGKALKTKDGDVEVETPDAPVETKGAIADEIAEDAAQKAKWKQASQICKIWYAFCDVYYDDDTAVTDFNSLLGEMIGLLTKVLNGTYTGPAADDDNNEGEAVAMALKGLDAAKVKGFFGTKSIVKKGEDVTYLQTVLQDIGTMDEITDRLMTTLSNYIGLANTDKASDDNADMSEGGAADGSNKLEASNTVKAIETLKAIDISSLKGDNLSNLATMLKDLAVAVEEQAHEAASIQATDANSHAKTRKRRLVLRQTKQTAKKIDKTVELVLTELKNIK